MTIRVLIVWCVLFSIAVPASAESSIPESSGIDRLAPLFDPGDWTVVQAAPLRFGNDETYAWVQLLKSIRPTGEDGVGRPLYSANLLVTANRRVLYSFAPLASPQRSLRIDPVYYVDDYGVHAGCPLEVRDVTGDGIPEILFHSGFVGASDWVTEIHVLKYLPGDPKHFRDVRGARFADSWWQKFRWVNRDGASIAIVADPIERPTDPCHGCSKFHQYQVHRWDESQGSFILAETIPSTGTLHRDNEDPLQTDWSYITSRLRE